MTLAVNLFRKAVETAAREMIVDGPAFVGFVETVEDAEEDRPQSDAGDFDDSLRQRERLEVAEDFVAAAKLAELLALVEKFDTVVVTAPFVVERAVVAASVGHPKARTVERDAVWGHVRGQRSEVRIRQGFRDADNR